MTGVGVGFGARLRRLARSHGIETAYRSAAGEVQEASDDALLAVLRAMGTPIGTGSDLDEAIELGASRRRARRLPPAQVIRGGDPPRALLRDAAAGAGGGRVECVLEIEGGETLEWSVQPEELETARASGGTFRILHLPTSMPHGVHRLRLPGPGPNAEPEDSWVIRAPRTVHGGAPTERDPREWGIFLPVHALRTRTDWGVGDLAGLRKLRSWAGERGAHTVATLPLLATYLDAPLEPSPYSPVSRLFWNELYLDPTRAPEFSRCPEARELVASPGFQQHLAALRHREAVDYAEIYAVKRRVLEMLARSAFENGNDARGPGASDLGDPERVRYGRFRSRFEAGGADWWDRTRGRADALPDTEPLDATAQFHVYVQSLLEREMGEGATGNGAAGENDPLPGLCLDLPLGCHPRGYDPWRRPELFADGVSVGAPPDMLSATGQDWGFPPLRPDASRAQGHRYWRDCLGTLLRPSGALRVDHVMALHRLFWIPSGMPASEGVYVRYPAEELYGVLAIESRRNECIVVGEDLGTVPDQVPEAMTRNGLLRTWVLPFELDPDAGANPVKPASQVALNTHDMPTFATFARELEPRPMAALRRRLAEEGHLPDPDSVALVELLCACLRWLADSPARLLLVNLEDLWLEERPQNVPGVGHEGGSWTRRTRYTLEELDDIPTVRAALAEIRQLRPGRRA